MTTKIEWFKVPLSKRKKQSHKLLKYAFREALAQLVLQGGYSSIESARNAVMIQAKKKLKSV